MKFDPRKRKCDKIRTEGVVGSIANDQKEVPVSHIELKGWSVLKVEQRWSALQIDSTFSNDHHYEEWYQSINTIDYALVTN